MSALHRFVVPDLAGPITGGTLYNRELIRALGECGLSCQALSLEHARSLTPGAVGPMLWLDSLFVHAAAELGARHPGKLGLLAHYLPSLVPSSGLLARAQLSPAEAAALSAIDAYLAPSAFMRSALERLGAGRALALVVEPGRFARTTAIVAASDPASSVRALMIGNLVPGKGIEPFLRELGAQLGAQDRLRLRIVGAPSDAEYAAHCRQVVAGSAALSERVELTGPVTPSRVVELLGESNLLISASRFESYGMALAEARTAGVPIVALAAGNVAAHVDGAAGGELVRSDEQLAQRCVRLCRNPAEHARRVQAARDNATPPRSWAEAARDFIAQLPGALRAYDQ